MSTLLKQKNTTVYNLVFDERFQWGYFGKIVW